MDTMEKEVTLGDLVRNAANARGISESPESQWQYYAMTIDMVGDIAKSEATPKNICQSLANYFQKNDISYLRGRNFGEFKKILNYALDNSLSDNSIALIEGKFYCENENGRLILVKPSIDKNAQIRQGDGNVLQQNVSPTLGELVCPSIAEPLLTPTETLSSRLSSKGFTSKSRTLKNKIANEMRREFGKHGISQLSCEHLFYIVEKVTRNTNFDGGRSSSGINDIFKAVFTPQSGDFVVGFDNQFKYKDGDGKFKPYDNLSFIQREQNLPLVSSEGEDRDITINELLESEPVSGRRYTEAEKISKQKTAHIISEACGSLKVTNVSGKLLAEGMAAYERKYPDEQIDTNQFLTISRRMNKMLKPFEPLSHDISFGKKKGVYWYTERGGRKCFVESADLEVSGIASDTSENALVRYTPQAPAASSSYPSPRTGLESHDDSGTSVVLYQPPVGRVAPPPRYPTTGYEEGGYPAAYSVYSSSPGPQAAAPPTSSEGALVRYTPQASAASSSDPYPPMGRDNDPTRPSQLVSATAALNLNTITYSYAPQTYPGGTGGSFTQTASSSSAPHAEEEVIEPITSRSKFIEMIKPIRSGRHGYQNLTPQIIKSMEDGEFLKRVELMANQEAADTGKNSKMNMAMLVGDLKWAKECGELCVQGVQWVKDTPVAEDPNSYFVEKWAPTFDDFAKGYKTDRPKLLSKVIDYMVDKSEYQHLRPLWKTLKSDLKKSRPQGRSGR